ncbi:hypothetical protein V8G54_016775 [Vigna mungo]|uniref:Annexin n=1 Tax=Vigna mungo TaxID=3915 RepID=A0AAQ3NM31_VIGMU
MSTLSIPPVIPSPREDAVKLHKAFKAMSLWLHDPPTRDAKIVRKALRPGVSDNQALTESICSRTPSQLRRLKEVYQSNYHSSLETDIEIQLSGDHKKAIKKETSGSFRYGLLTILRCATDPALYFAKILRKSMKGVGTQDSRLIRVVVTRTEVDMYHIKIAYYKKYGKPLTHAVRSDTSGHYKEFLLSLIGSDY